MEEHPIEQVQEEITNENIQEFLTSKAFKKRVAAYKEIDQYPELVNLVQNETLAVALEPALSCLLNFKGKLTNNEICNLYLQFTQSKASIKSLLFELIDKVFINDQVGVIKGLASLFSHKNPKVVLGCVTKVKELINENNQFFNSKEGKDLLVGTVCPNFEIIFSNTDKDVKSEGSQLAVSIFKILFELTLKFLENVKPIILKDLKDLFSTVQIPPREVKISDLEFDHSDWKERLSALNFLKENISNMSNKNEVISILFRKTKDPNLQVVMATVECIKRGGINHPDCIRGIVDRFKDKKAPLTLLIKETIQTLMPDINLLIDSLESKNPDIKIGVLECLKFYPTVIRVCDIAKLLEDSSSDVRRLASEVLNSVENLEGLSDTQLSKLKRRVVTLMPHDTNINDTNIPNGGNCIKKELPTSTVINKSISNSRASLSPKKISIENKSPQPTHEKLIKNDLLKSIEIFNPSDFDYSLDQNTKSNINEEFIQKFPFLMEKDWMKKLEAISSNSDQIKSESPLSITLYLLSSRETNFHIFKAFMQILESYSDLNTAKTPLVTFLNSKITESKLKDPMVNLFKKLDQNFLIQNFLNCLKTNKTGKRFLTFLEFFILVLRNKNPLIDQFLEDFRVIGVQEKKALNSFIDEYSKLPGYNPNNIVTNTSLAYENNVNNFSSKTSNSNNINTTHYNENTLNNSNSANEIPNTKNSSLQQSNNSKNEFKIFLNQINPSLIKNCNQTPSKFFTPEFLNLFENNIGKAVVLLEQQNLVLISDFVISLYCTFSVPSTYFNSLILHFIANKYILHENEAIYLVNFLVENSMTTELEMLDRIYPATKLYKIFRSIQNENGLKSIFALICKYKILRDLKYNEIQRIVNENEDFIGFSIEIEKFVKMKEELRMKYENQFEDNKNAHDEIYNGSYSNPKDMEIVNKINDSLTGLDTNNFITRNSNNLKDQEIINKINGGPIGLENLIKNNKHKAGTNNTCEAQDKISKSMNSINTVEKINNAVTFFNQFTNSEKRNEDSVNCININDDPNDINDLEDSIIIEAIPSIEQFSPDPQQTVASVIIASSVADIDSYSTLSNQNEFDIPNSCIDCNSVLDFEVERSLENISISTTPQKKKRNLNPMEILLEKLKNVKDEDMKGTMESISQMIFSDPKSFIGSCNSMIVELLECLKNKYENTEMRDLILPCLLKITQQVEVCSFINYETLVAINTALIPLVKDKVLIADILINLCLNCDLQILRVYFDLLNNNDEILMKLIWRHSKRVNYNSTENVAVVVRIIDSFYQSKREFLFKAENIILKVCLLHLKECIVVFSDNIKEFGIGEVTSSIVKLLISSKDLNLEAIRKIFKSD